MRINHLPLWRRSRGGKFYDYTYLIDTSRSTFLSGRSICDAVNRLIELDWAISQHSRSDNHFVTILTFGSKINVIQYMQPLKGTRISYREDWNMERESHVFEALITAIEMAENRMGALAEAGRAEIKLTLFSDGIDNGSPNESYDNLKEVLERVKGCPTPWQLKMYEDEEENIEDFFDIPLYVVPRKFDVRDDYSPVDYKPFTTTERAMIRAQEIVKIRNGAYRDPFGFGAFF